MVTDLIRAATLSVVGETIAICRYEDEVIAFVNGKPIPYRMFMPLLLTRVFPQATSLSEFRRAEIGGEATRLINKMADLGVCDWREILAATTVTKKKTKRMRFFGKPIDAECETELTRSSGYRLCFVWEMIIDHVLTKARERSTTTGDALEYLISNIEEQYEAAVQS